MVAYFVGAYSADMGGTATGIAALGRLDDGSLEYLGLAAVSDSPAYLASHGDRVYAVEEAAGTVREFTRGDGFALDATGESPAGGAAPCHVARYGDTVITSCYVDGHLGVLSTDPLGLDAVLEGQGSGPHPAQDGSHAHATVALDDSSIVSADLGADRLYLHALVDGVLTRTGEIELPAGTGPRDFLRGPGGYLYVLGELSLEVLVFDDELTFVGRTPLPGARPGDHAAALTLSAAGDFVWAGLRGSNRIAVLGVSHGGRALSAVTSVSAEGDWPRHHVVDGDVMHVAHERSNTVASFRLGDDGIPTLIEPPIEVPSPIFLLAV
ncbi:6-phosphogluconolactonase (cycloisomerase 2 family) [Conyzicola lurida]|uniref:6-phosphogluconolactonase (Cycloisomerase 2 family) n=1 Tax=Conyzicola lurida TaxID=1172621 RepID=A0A841AP52_9MICO|nr:beta-propeller fold lactonase family protein [Conyzicola lurida]MBB5843373.1 6-phosphogluconolactonase (cycloisomerase 2 family) [Conyzicola lurida]